MRIDGLQLREGSYITNMSIAAGSAFPNSPNTGELFYRTDSENVGLHVYDSSNTSWNKCFTSGDVALSLPANTTPGTYKSVTVNNQGIVSAGTNPTTLAGYGIVDAQALDADLTAIAALAGTSGLLKKTAADTWTLDTNTYLTSNQTITLTGGVTGSGTTSINATVVTNANLTGVVTSVGNATSIANGAISNGMLANGSITLGSTNIVLGSTTTTLAGLISVTSTGFTGALNGTVGATTPNTGVFTSVSVSGKISSTTDSTSPADGSAYFYKSSPGAVVSGYQVIIETGLAGNRTTKATFDNIGNLGLGNIPSAWSFGGNIQMTSAACLTFNGPSYIGSNFYNNGGWRYTDTAPSSIYSQTSGRHIWSNAVSGSIGALISFVQGMELDANNNLIVTGSISGTSFNSITGLSSTLPAAAGTAAIGVSTTAARSDHVHGLQTSVSGTAGSLATGRTFSLSTDATGTSAAFDGSANVTIPMTLATVNSNVGSFGSATQVASITLDAKGRATAASNVSIAIPTSAVTSGTFADARIATSNVTQHQASLTIAETQITDGTLLARNAGNETISGNWTFSNVVTGVTPSAASHLTTKAYVDGLVTGLDTKASCRAATTANITLSGTQTIDGVAVIAGNRVLVKDQSTASQNGIYDVAAGAWVRSADADNLPGTEVTAGMYTFISEGTVNADTGWTLSTNDTVVLGTTPLTFTQFTGLGQISAGAGLTKTGSVIDIGTASASRIVINTDNIDLATAGTAGTYRSVTTDAYGRVTNGTNPTTLAGYGITDAVTAVSVVTANGVSGSVTSTTTPAITLTLGAITPTSVTATGQIAAQSSIFNNTTGTSSTWQHNSTSVGDIGTGNQVISGGSSADFGVTSRAGKLVLGTGSIARATIDTSGNLGLGVTPSAWVSSWKAVDVTSGGSSLYGTLAIGGIATNAFFDSSSAWKYKTSYGAARYEHDSVGSHKWYTAPSGTAGNAITFTQAMTLDASGNLDVFGRVTADNVDGFFLNQTGVRSWTTTATGGNLNIGAGDGLGSIIFNGDKLTISSTGLKAVSLSDSNYTRITNPGGGSLVNMPANTVGALKIVLPVGMTNTMIRMTIKVYEYNSTGSFEINCGGYLYSPGLTWANNPFAYIVNSPLVNRNYTVRFGYTAGGKAVVYIGELNTVWNYPQVFVTDVQLGYGGYGTPFATGWVVGVEPTAFENVTATVINTQISLASTVAGSALGTAAVGSALAYARADHVHQSPTNISGNAATVTTNANLTGPITSVGNATSIASQTGTGSTFVMSSSPSLTGHLTITGSGIYLPASTTIALSGFTAALEITAQGNAGTAGASVLTFHRPGAYAINLGLDTDNVLKIGGASAGAVSYKIWHSGNDGAGSNLDADLLDGQQGSYYLNLANSNGAASSANRLKVVDRRAVVQTPSYFGMGADLSFMQNSTDGLSDGGTYHGIFHLQPYSDASGGGAYEVGFTDNNNMWLRGSSGALTTWGAWKKIWDSANLTNLSQLSNGPGYATGGGTASGTNTGDNAVNSTYANDYRAANFVAGTNYLAPNGSGAGLTGTAGALSIGGNAATSTVTSMLQGNAFITYGASGAQWMNISGAGGAGTNGQAPPNPSTDWYHHLIQNHANGGGYYVDFATCFHSDTFCIRRVANGVDFGFRTLIHSGNIGSQSVASATTATTLQTARTINGVSFNGSANITINAVDSTARIASSEKGAANGVATLDGSGLIPTGQLPSYVDDVLEYANLASFPGSGATGKIYVALDTNKTYRWSGSAYVYITSGAVDSVAGKTGVVTLVKADVGLGSVDNTADSVKSVSYAATAGSANQIDGVNFINTGSATPTNADTVASNGISYYTAGVPNFTGNATDGALHTQVHTAGTWEHQIAGDYRSGQIALRGKNNGTWQAWRTVWDSVNLTNLSQLSNGPGFITSSGSITGNAASATVLQTARTINGVSFNGSANIKTTEWFHSGRDFPLGTAIYTDIDYSVTAGDSFIIEIKGNAYGAIIPFDMQIQGYIYSNTIINITSVSNGQQIPGIVALNVGGLLTIWFPTMSYWQGFNVRVYRSTSGQNYNAVTSITNTAKPSGTKEVSLMANAVQSWHTGNLTNLSQLSNGPGYATGGGTASGTNTGDNAANTNYANDYRAANFVAGTNYLAPNGSAAGLTSFPTFNQNTTGYARMLDSPDGDRLSSTKLPSTSPNKVRFDFVGGGQVGSPGSTYAGLMTYAPWLGTTASTGDASYQLAFASTATNGSGFPVLKLRKGIDSTWNTWYDVLTSATFVAGTNYVTPAGNAATATTLQTARTINGVSFNGSANITVTAAASDVYAWAKAAVKPTYTAAEVGAPSGSGTSSGTNTGDETLATIKSKLGITTLSGSNTGDNAANTNYENDYNAANFVAGADYLAPNGSAAALTGFPTLNQNTTGNAATATAISGTATIIGYSTSGQPISYTNTGGPQIMGQSAGAAMLSFHRPGAYAVNFGLDTDNILKVGGWSMGAVSYKIWHEGNDGAGSGLDADLLDGQSSAYFAPISAPSFTSTITVAGVVTANAGITEKKSALGALNINLALSTYFSKTISATSTLTVSNVPASGNVGSFILDLTNGGAFAITWWSGMKWAGGTAPTLTASGRDVLAFFTHDGGTTWNGLVLAKDIK